jgi:transcriptional regulator with XRE-family HTH domain
MPRVNMLRSLENEQNLARRIAYERERAGQSYAGLAKRMEDAGYPMQSSAIFKIEKGDPPRRITVDELVGFSAVFGVPVSDLLLPPEVVADKAMHAALDQLNAARMEFEHAQADLTRTEDQVERELSRLGIKLGDVQSGIAEDGHAFVIADISERVALKQPSKRTKRKVT